MVIDKEKDIDKRPAKQGAEAVISEPNKIGASTPYDFEAKNLTAYGGLLPVATMLERLGFQQLVEETLTVKRLTRAMGMYQFVLAMVLALYVGFSRLNHVRFLEREPMLTGRIFSGRVVIPIHNESGQLLAYCGRAVDATQPRYRFPSGFAKSEVVFNLHRATAASQQPVVIVEGFFDCLKLYQAGVHAVVALMGSALYAAQECALLQRFHRVILMLDGDATGRRATVEIATRLRTHCSLQIVHVPDGMQPDQMTADEIRQALAPCRTTDVIGPIQLSEPCF
jgi:5S rRNA maturation endonuclease (ribonuclease M5)